MLEMIRNWLRKTSSGPKPVPTSGMEACMGGFQLKDNPFREHTLDHSIWRDEWMQEECWKTNWGNKV